MKRFRKIVTFGDSFAWGDELLAPDQKNAADYGNRFYREQNCYTGILAKHYGVPAENLAFPGGSCQSTRWIYTWWRRQEPHPEHCLVLVQLSGAWRSSQFMRNQIRSNTNPVWNQFIHSAWIHAYKNTDPHAYQYFLLEQDLCDCDERSTLVQAETYLFFQGQTTDVAAMFMFNSQGDSFVHDLMPKCLLWQGLTFEEWLGSECFAPKRHLNEFGHKQVAENLISEIDRVILVE